MTSKSFYDLDYIIEINEKRLDQYTSAYQKVLERLTNIILIYSAITIFIVPIVQDIFLLEIKNWLLYACFIVFVILFLISIIYTIRLVVPVEVDYLEKPKRYYEEYRLTYEKDIKNQEEIEKLLRASYINELESALDTNYQVFKRKSSFYYNALIYVLLSTIPYLICLGFHISKKEDKVQKVEVVASEIIRNLHKNDLMANNSDKGRKGGSSNTTTTTTTTNLPGVNSSQVIASAPLKLKENSQYSSSEKR